MTSAVQAPSTEAMSKPSATSGWAALSAFVLWALLAAGGAWMVLQAWPRQPSVSESAVSLDVDGLRVADVRRVLQAPSAPVTAQVVDAVVTAAPASVKVLGVVATASGQGAALLQVGQEPPKPYAPGAQVPGLGVVQSVTPQAIQVGSSRNGPVTLTLAPPKSDPPQR